MNSKYDILLVEDSRTQALQFTSVLQKAGWGVVHATSAAEAMELLDRRAFDLILIDYFLPSVRGDQLCRQVRMRMDARVVPIVILTGDSGQQTLINGLDSGADDFITKSVDEEVLLVRLRALLSKAQSTPKPLVATPSDFHNARLLAVDDSRTYLAYLVAQLQAESYQIETTADGRNAIELLRHGEFDCVLVDLVMPGMDGIEVCRQINTLRQKSGKSAMVLMLTAKEDNQSLARALEAGADDFVSKSSDIIVIKGRIRALLRRRFYEEEHHRRLSAELRAKELEVEHARVQKEAAEARSALVDDLEKTALALRRSNEELQQFAYVASHDLQEPLRVIAGYVELLARRYKDKLDDDAREFITFAVDGAVRMKTLISDLLAYSRVDTQGNQFEAVNTTVVLDQVLLNLQTAVQESNAQITHDPLPTVNGDRTQLIQLFQNLVSNAIKYRGSTPPRIHLAVHRDENSWIYSISDNGIGIDPQHFERIFVVFQRLHTASEYPGTGIGLSIAKRIVERHGGQIRLESKPGHGTTFFFALSVLPEVAANNARSRLAESSDAPSPIPQAVQS